MKRAKNLIDRIPERANLELAVRRALRGKRGKGDAIAYVERLEANLDELAAQIRSGGILVGRSTQFTIRDPKERLITAPCFAERVLHHAIMNVCEPEFERRLVFHSYACRRGKGQFAALHAARRFAAGHGWFLKMDVRKYFESIPKAGLLARLGRVFAEERLLGLFADIVEAHDPGSPRGLPIGSLISQHCANLYLDPVDRFVTERLGCGAYVRYMDDFVVWSDSRADLKRGRAEVGGVLDSLGLAFKGEPYPNRVRHGMDFLGHRVHGRRVSLNRRSRRRYAGRMAALAEALVEGRIGEREAQGRATSLLAFAAHFGGDFLRRCAKVGPGGVPKARTA